MPGSDEGDGRLTTGDYVISGVEALLVFALVGLVVLPGLLSADPPIGTGPGWVLSLSVGGSVALLFGAVRLAMRWAGPRTIDLLSGDPAPLYGSDGILGSGDPEGESDGGATLPRPSGPPAPPQDDGEDPSVEGPTVEDVASDLDELAATLPDGEDELPVARAILDRAARYRDHGAPVEARERTDRARRVGENEATVRSVLAGATDLSPAVPDVDRIRTPLLEAEDVAPTDDERAADLVAAARGAVEDVVSDLRERSRDRAAAARRAEAAGDDERASERWSAAYELSRAAARLDPDEELDLPDGVADAVDPGAAEGAHARHVETEREP